jgi:LytS/YehU family sensor histidine kinase
MGPRLAYALDLPPTLAQAPVPTLLLQPLVENSIRHGLEPQVEGGRIEVGARQQGGSLVLTVRDTGAGLDPAQAPGFGLTQVRERLVTAYGPGATLRARAPEGGGTLITLTLPLP